MLAAATAQAFEQLRPAILHKAVKVLTSTGHGAYHLLHRLDFVGRLVVSLARRSRENAANERVLVPEALVARKYVAEGGPADACESTNEAKNNVQRPDRPLVLIPHSTLLVMYV